MKKFLFFLLLLCQSTFADQLIVEPDAGITPILSAINQAHSSIDLVIYGLTDHELIHALVLAKNRGVKINILLEPHPYENTAENQATITLLKLANIDIHYTYPVFQLTHQKTLIIDNHDAYIMNFNFTHSAFTQERNFALLTQDPNIIKEIETVMQHDEAHEPTSVDQENLVWSPNNSRAKLLALIQNAKSSIKIYAQSITDYQLIGELAKKSRAGVNIEILTSDTPNTKNQGKYAYLTKAGVHLFLNKKYYIHAKVILVDNNNLLIGSTNLTSPSIDHNREVSLLTHNPTIIQSVNYQYEVDQK